MISLPRPTTRELRAWLTHRYEHGYCLETSLSRAEESLGYPLASCLRLERTSFAAVRDDVRKHLAHKWLSQGMAVSEAAEALGFPGIRSFRCAFRSWTGKSPEQVREVAELCGWRIQTMGEA